MQDQGGFGISRDDPTPEIEVHAHAVHRMALELDLRRAAVAGQGQHFVGHAEAAGSHAHLADDLLDSAPGVGVVGLVEMTDAQGL